MKYKLALVMSASLCVFRMDRSKGEIACHPIGRYGIAT